MHVRDLSVIATPPEGRLPIKTFLEPFDEYHIREAMLREMDRGGQIYFVHNRVQTIEAVAERSAGEVPRGLEQQCQLRCHLGATLRIKLRRCAAMAWLREALLVGASENSRAF